MVFGHHLSDILAVIKRLSLELQKETIGIYRSHEEISSSITALKMLMENPGPHLRSVQNVTEFQDVKLEGDLAKTFSDTVASVVGDVIECLEDRCSNVFEGILLATKIADLSTWPPQSTDTFGNDFVQTIAEHFEKTFERLGVDRGLLQVEWIDLRSTLYNSHRIEELDWVVINHKYKDRCPNILALFDLVLSLPASSSLCERGFSQMKLTKTAYRNRMGSHTLSDLLTVKLHSDNIEEFDPAPAISLWYKQPKCGKSRQRRPAYMENPATEESMDQCEAGQMLDPEGFHVEAEETSGEQKEDDAVFSDYDSDFSENTDTDTDTLPLAEAVMD